MTLKGGTSQACAACKYQRRRCTPNCQLAPYFPADQPKMFQNAHRLFGVSNILKILKQLDASQKMIAMRSIIYQANVRDKFPVNGCLGIIQHLCYQIQLAEEELQSVHSQLNFYKQNPPPPEIPNNSTTVTTLNDSMSQLQLGLMSMSPPNSGPGGLPFFHHHHHQDNINNNSNNINSSDFQFQYIGGGGSNNICYTTTNNNNSNDNCYVDSSKENNNKNNNNNATNVMWNIQQQQQSAQFITTNLEPHQEQEQEEIEEGGGGGDVVVQDYDDMHPFLDTIDDRQSYIDSKEAYESSPESSIKDTTQSIEHVGENELKSAAACFTLTSVN